jgi:hypothetical protein
MDRGKPPAQPYSDNLKRLDGNVAAQRAALEINGGALLYGTAAPTTEGSNGDYYIRTTTNFIYGPKASGVWPSGTSLVGPPGVDGTDGSDGTFDPVANNTLVGNVSGGTAIPAGLNKASVKSLLGFIEAADMQAAATWAAIFAQITDPLIGGVPWNSGGYLVFSTGTFNRPDGTSRYLRPDGTSTYTRA